MNKLSTYLKENGYMQAKVVNGPNGDFVVAAKEDNSIATFPVGKNSQGETDIFAYFAARCSLLSVASFWRMESRTSRGRLCEVKVFIRGAWRARPGTSSMGQNHIYSVWKVQCHGIDFVLSGTGVSSIR